MVQPFIGTDILRSEFWQAINTICRGAVDDLAWFGEFTKKNVVRGTADELREQAGYEPSMFGTPQPNSPDEVLNGIPIRHDLIARWRRKWHLDGAQERNWVTRMVIVTVAWWVIHEEDLRNKEMTIGINRGDSPKLTVPSLAIETTGLETWNDFERRATAAFRSALADYKDAMKEYGKFKRNLERDAQWLVAHQVTGLSWNDISASERLNPMGHDYDNIRKAAARLAKALPLSLRT